MVTEGELPRFARGDVVVCIRVFSAAEHFARCLASVVRHADGELTVLVADDASADPAVERIAGEIAADRDKLVVLYLRRPGTLGLVATLNGVCEATAPADVVILNSDCV